MTPQEHYDKAEKVLARAEQIHDSGHAVGDLVALAQVHATLATADTPGVRPPRA